MSSSSQLNQSVSINNSNNNNSSNSSSSSSAVSNPYLQTLTAYTAVILISDVSSILIRLLVCVGMFKCRLKCHPFDVSCLIVANLSFNYGMTSWIVEYAVGAIPIRVSFTPVCYLINARHIFWILSNHSLVALSFNRVYLIHRSLCSPIINKPSTSCVRRWGFSVVFHSLNFGLLLAYHLMGYFTGSVVFTKWETCSKKTRSDVYTQINYFLRNLIPCLAMAINYVVVVPIYLMWHLRDSRARKSVRDEMHEKRVDKVIKLSLMHFIYTFCQASSWLISTGVTEFVLKKDTVPLTSSYNSTTTTNTTANTTKSSPQATPVTMFGLFFGDLNNEALVGVWWLELIAWLYMILDTFNPLVLIFLHTHLHRSIGGILMFWKQAVVKYPRAMISKMSSR